MSVILFILGILVTGAGIVTIGLGIPINEFNLGNTLIVSGTIALSSGLILIGLAAAVDQLAQLVKALRPRPGTRPVQPQAADQPLPVPARAAPIPAQAPSPGQPQAPAAGPAKAPVPAAAPRNPIFTRGRGEERAGEPAAAEATTEVSSSAIERLRSSLARSDRKTSESAPAEDASYTSPTAPTQAAPSTGTNGAAAPATSAADAPKKKPPLDFLFRSRARESQPESFDAVWPKRGARQIEDTGEAARSAASEAPKPPAGDMPAGEGARSTAILKSGVVDGMAYTLYVDGSIEAQLPQGTVRFGSIAELRSHIENNS